MAETTWRPSRKKYGVTILNFAGDVKNGLQLQIGEAVQILEEYGTGATGWYRGMSLHKKGPKGIFPASLIHIKDCEVDNEGPNETITPLQDVMVKEMAYVLREWYTMWKDLFLQKGLCTTFLVIKETMTDLLSLRGRLVSDANSQEQAKDLRQEIASLIDWGDGKIGMDLVPRVEGEQVDPDQCSVTGLYKLHTESAAFIQSDVPKKRISGESQGPRGDSDGLYHLLVNFKSSQCAIMEESLVYLSVFNAREGIFISEQFEVCVNKNGLAQDIDKISKYFGLFTDLSSDDLDKRLFIVVKIYRCGKMLATTVQKGGGRTYRRPFGVGVMKVEEIRHMASTEKEYETMVKIYSCVDNENAFPDQHEVLVKKALQQLGSSSRLGSSFREDKVVLGVTFSFKMFQGDLQTIKTEEAILFSKGVTMIPKLSFTDLIINPGAMRNDIYLTLVSGEYDRGKKKSEKNVEIVVTAFNSKGEEIKDCMSFGCGEKPQTNFYSTIYYHDNSPKWNETVRLSLPMEMLPQSCIRFDFYHCSTRGRSDKKLVGFAFLSVTNAQNIVIHDGLHDLCIYQCEDISKVVYKKFKGLPFLYDDYGDPRMSVMIGAQNNHPYKKSARERLTIKTQLCSTKYTQTSDLLGLLQWKLPGNQKRLPQILDQLNKMEGVEIMKFLPDVLDSLFAIMTDSCANANSNCPKVFQVLVYVLALLQDSRFVTFVPVLDNYLSDQFSSPMVHRDMLKCFADGIHSYCNGGVFTVSLGLKVLEQLLRFVVRSRELQMSLGNADETEFKRNLHHLFDKMGELVSKDNDRIKISQMALLSNLHRAYGPLRSMLTLRELADLVVVVVMKMPKSNKLPEDVQRNKLDFIQETVNSELFQADESRCVILPLCLAQIKCCMIEKMMLPQATSILGDILHNVFIMKQKRCMEKDMKTIVLSVFEVILQTVLATMEKATLCIQLQPSPEIVDNSPKSLPKKRIFPNRNASINNHRQRPVTYFHERPKTEFDPIKWKNRETPDAREISHMVPMCLEADEDEISTAILPATLSSDKKTKITGKLISCLIDILRLMDEKHYEDVMQMFPEYPPLKDFLMRVFLTFQELIKPEVFPPHWTVMRLVTNNVIFTAVEYFSQALTKHFLHSDDFDLSLWQHYFYLAVAFITQPSLQLEKYSEAKRKKTKERYQDMRVPMGYQMQTLWEKLGNSQRFFIPSLIGPFLEVTLVPEHELRSATLLIFYDMMKCEQRLNGNFLLVENEIIEKLDIFITTGNKGDNQYRELFRTILLDKVQTDPTLQENGSQFILSVTSLLERLLDYRNVYEGEENGDRRMQTTFNILNFYKDNSNRQEMYMRYIKKLYDLQLSAKNYVEAGLTLQLYTKLLNWTDDIKQGEMGYQPQAEWERKESTYLTIIDCFDQGRVWEYGIPLCKELAKFYEERLLYRKLSLILQRQAAFFSKILDGVEVIEDGQKKFYPRQKPSFFRVAYYGHSFPPFVRNKAFVYRGHACLKLQDIINQLTLEFPQATIMKTNTPPTEEMKGGETQFIQICGVEPVAVERPEFKNCSHAATEIKKFYNDNDVDTFQFDKSFYRGGKDENNEFKSLCTERILMKTSYKFPGILQWYEVVGMETMTLNPLPTAIEAVRSACRRLKDVVTDCQRKPNEDNIKHLSMLLNGMISANVMGGLPKYQEAFFSNDFAMEHPEETHQLPELRQCIQDQVCLLDRGLKQMRKAGHRDLDAMVTSLEGILKGIKESVSDKGSQSSLSNKRPDSGTGSFNGVMYQPRAGTPSNSSVHSSGSNRSSEYMDTQSLEEGIYTDPEIQSYISSSRHGSDPNLKQLRPDSNTSVRQEGDYRYPDGPPTPYHQEPKKKDVSMSPLSAPLPILSHRHSSSPPPSPSPSMSSLSSMTTPHRLPRRMSEPTNDDLPPIPRKIPTTHADQPLLPPKVSPMGMSVKTGIGRSGPPLPPRVSMAIPTKSPSGAESALSRSISNFTNKDTSHPVAMVGRSNKSSSSTSLNTSAGADYKQLEVISPEPPPIPSRPSPRTSATPQVSPRISVASRDSTASSHDEEDTQL